MSCTAIFVRLDMKTVEKMLEHLEEEVEGARDYADRYIEFQKSVIINRTQFDLDKALREMHILEGYKIAIDNIDEVIATIKKSASIPDAKEKLMERFGLTEVQAQALPRYRHRLS